MQDIRLSEMTFLQMVEKGDEHPGRVFFVLNKKFESIKLRHQHLIELAVYLLESGYVRFRDDRMQKLVALLRGEYSGKQVDGIDVHEWIHPRNALESRLLGGGQIYEIDCTYTGLRRIEELRDALRSDRILEPFGVALDVRYYHPDLRDALARSDIKEVAVMGLDLDNFKRVNDEFGHPAGDEVMKAYLTTVRDVVSTFGGVYRGRGDEVFCLLPGFGQQRAAKLAEVVKMAVAAIEIMYDGSKLPGVTTSIGVAASPPCARSPELEKVADLRQRDAKQKGKNCVVAEGHG